MLISRPPEIESLVTNDYEVKIILHHFEAERKKLLHQMWKYERKDIRNRYQVDVAIGGLIPIDDNQIYCIFNANNVPFTAHVNGKEKEINPKINPKIYQNRFKDSSRFWLEDFRAKLEQAADYVLQGSKDADILRICYPREERRVARKAERAARRTARRIPKIH